jgi:hypothetical protein
MRQAPHGAAGLERRAAGRLITLARERSPMKFLSIVGSSMVVNIRTGSAVYIEAVSRLAATDHDRKWNGRSTNAEKILKNWSYESLPCGLPVADG